VLKIPPEYFYSNTSTLGQNKTMFGSGFTPSQTGFVGPQPQQDSETSLFQENSNNLYGSNAFGKQTTGTVIKFSPVMGTDTIKENGMIQSVSTKYHCITRMKEYENKSLEELRFEDNTCNRKGLQQKPVFQASTVGTPTSSTTNSLCGQTHNKTQFGQPQGFGQLPSFGPSTVAFGVPNKTSTSSRFTTPTTFGTTTSSASTFCFNPLSTSNFFSANQAQKPLFGITSTQPQPAFGTGVFGQTNTPNTTTNLFQKPAQTTTGFNTGQLGFSFNQTGTIQASNLFQVSKPNTGFGIFGQTNAGTPGFGQTSQPAFGQTNSTNDIYDFQNPTTNLFQKPAQTTTGFNTEQSHFPFNQVSRPSRFEVDPFSRLTSWTSTPGVGQSTLTFGVTNQTNTSSVFSEPPIFETEGLKKELKNKTIVADKLCNKLTIMSQFEKEVSEAVDKFKKAFKQGIEMQELLIKIEEVKSELKEEVHTMLTDKWNVERSKFDTQIEKLNKKIFTLETIIESKEKLIERLVGCFKEERESILKANLKIGELQNWKINKLKDELSRNNANLGYDADTGTNVVAEIEQFEEKFNPILELESNLNEEKQKYQNLTVKYEILEEEHVVTKAKLIMEKETMENQLSNMKSEVEKLEAELKALKKTYNEQHQPDQIRLESSLEGKRSELDQLKKENEVINDELEHMRKESNELKEKSNGYEKVNKVTGNISIMDTSDIDNEIRQLEPKPNSIEEPKTLELEECKMNDENKKIVLQKSLTDEIAKAN
jgi:hypothetical protein